MIRRLRDTHASADDEQRSPLIPHHAANGREDDEDDAAVSATLDDDDDDDDDDGDDGSNDDSNDVEVGTGNARELDSFHTSSSSASLSLHGDASHATHYGTTSSISYAEIHPAVGSINTNGLRTSSSSSSSSSANPASKSARRNVSFGKDAVSPAASSTRARRPKSAKSKSTTAISTKFESLDYDILENEIYVKEQSKNTKQDYVKLEVARWVVMFFIGFLTALVAFTIDYLLTKISGVKFGWISNSINNCIENDCLSESMLMWIAIDLALVSVAACLVLFLEPVAQGSGIPEIKCYLNGIKIPHVVRVKTLITKAIGVLCSVAGGLSCGKEGPMIHIGSVIAAGISQGKSTTFNIDLNLFKAFRTDHEKRDFVSGGAAAGVSAAFGAPIGGVLFSLEEGASFWNQALTWRIFFCSMTASFTLNLFLSGTKGGSWGAMSSPGLVNFGRFDTSNYNLFELPIFIAMGAVAGLFGALFNALSYRLTIFRRKYVHPYKILKFFEVWLVAAGTVVLAFSLIYYDDNCLPLGEKPGENPLEFFCKEHQYNEIATMLFNTPEESIKNLFHATKGDYSPSTLAIFFVVMFVLSCWTYGIAVPSGLFVPSLLTGAAYGRLVGNILYHLFPDQDWVDPGKYALIGAASFLGGVVRMTISLTVIVVEATGNISYGLPLMLSIMAAKLVGDLFNDGIYDIHIHLRQVPLLGWEAPLPMQNFHASHVMSANVKCVYEFDRVGRIVHLLQTTTHNAFPVVSDDGIQQWRNVHNPSSTPLFDSGSGLGANASLANSLRTGNVNLNASMINLNMSGIGNMMGVDIVRARNPRDLNASMISTSGNDWGFFGTGTGAGANSNMLNTSTMMRASSSTPSTSFLNLNGGGPSGDDSEGVGSKSYGTLCGIVLRSQLITLLQKKSFGPKIVDGSSVSVRAQALTVDDFREAYPRYPSIHSIVTSDYEKELYVNLKPYMNPTPYTLKHTAPLSRVYRIFRGLGLRHLVITDRFNQVVGMVSRKDLTKFEIVSKSYGTKSDAKWVLREREMLE